MAQFENNDMKLNSGKQNFPISGNKSEQVLAQIGENKIWETGKVKLLGINIDNNFKFDERLSNTCMKANRKLIKVRKYLDIDKTRIFFKAISV